MINTPRTNPRAAYTRSRDSAPGSTIRCIIIIERSTVGRSETRPSLTPATSDAMTSRASGVSYDCGGGPGPKGPRQRRDRPCRVFWARWLSPAGAPSGAGPCHAILIAGRVSPSWGASMTSDRGRHRGQASAMISRDRSPSQRSSRRAQWRMMIDLPSSSFPATLLACGRTHSETAMREEARSVADCVGRSRPITSSPREPTRARLEHPCHVRRLGRIDEQRFL
jgi:hypothetical protein